MYFFTNVLRKHLCWNILIKSKQSDPLLQQKRRKKEKKKQWKQYHLGKGQWTCPCWKCREISCTSVVALSILLDFFISSFRATIVRSYFWQQDQKVTGYFHYRFALNLSAKSVGYIWRQIAWGNVKRLAQRLKQNEYSIQVFQAENYHFFFLRRRCYKYLVSRCFLGWCICQKVCISAADF